MKPKYLLVFLFLVSQIVINAQQIEISKPIDESMRDFNVKYLGHSDNKQFFLHRVTKIDQYIYSIQSYNEKFEPLQTLELGTLREQPQVVIKNNEILSIYVEYNSVFKGEYYHYSRHKTSDFSVITPAALVFDNIKNNSENSSNSYLHVAMDDEKQNLVLVSFFRQESKHIMAYVVFDRENKISWKKEEQYNASENSTLTLQDVLIDKNQNVVLLSRQTGGSQVGNEYVKKVDLNIYRCSKNGIGAKISAISFDEKPLVSVQALFDENKLVLTCLYGQKDYNETKGIATLIYELSNNTIVSKKFYDFPAEQRCTYLKGKKKESALEKDKSGEKILVTNRSRMDYIIKRADGGYIAIAEENDNNITTKYVPSATYAHKSGHIIVTYISPKGEVELTTVVAKMTHSNEYWSYPCNYQYLYKNDKLHLIFNDNPLNVSNLESELTVNMSESTNNVVMVTLDNKGNQIKKNLTVLSDLNVKINPSKSLPVDETGLIILGKKKYKELYIAKFKL